MQDHDGGSRGLGRSTVKTAVIGQIARVDAAIVGFNAPPAEGEPKPSAGPFAAFLERAEQIGDVRVRRPLHSSRISISTRSALAPTRA
jgi:hypothetical protein